MKRNKSKPTGESGSKKAIPKSARNIIILVVIGLILTFFGNISRFMIDWQWFADLGYTDVFFKRLFTQLQFTIPVFFVEALIFFVFLKAIAHHIDKNNDILKTPKEKSGRNKLILVVAIVIAAFEAISFGNEVWYSFLSFKNATAFGVLDPIYGKDISFYVFVLPFVRSVLDHIFVVLGNLAIAAVIYNGYMAFKGVASKFKGGQGYQAVDEHGNLVFPNFGGGNVDFDFKEFFLSVVKQINVIIGLFFIALGANSFLKTYEIMYSKRGIAFGPGFVDIKITLPSLYIAAAVCVLAGLLFMFAGKRMRPAKLIIAPIVVVMVVFGSGLAEMGVQRLLVDPNEIGSEEPYLQNNIDMTNKAYGTDKVEVKSVKFDNKLTRDSLAANKPTINNIPINDYRPARVIYNQIQGFKNYYNFTDIDIDRYTINGQYRQMFISARELVDTNIPGTASGASAWINKYLKYTHGYGVAMSPVNEVTSSGQPVLFTKNMPIESNVGIKITQPQIYFGEMTNDFVIVKTNEKEIDYPERDANVESVFEADSGINLTPMNRLFMANLTGKMNFILSTGINSESKVLVDRNILKRAKKIAPFLVYDSDPYIVVSEGKLYWIIDAFTESSRYPYSEPVSRTVSTNYVRNSVKVVIDAYTGDIDYYIADSTDPIAVTCSKIFGTLFKPLEDMPKDLKSHIRYSQVMFDIQSNVFKKYHIEDARALYNKSDLWDISTQISVNYGESIEDSKNKGGGDMTQDSNVSHLEGTDQTGANGAEAVESAYTIIKLPGAEKEEFLLMVPFTPQGKNNMIAWLGVNCDGEEYGKLLLYKFPSGQVVEGTMQVEGLISQDTVISPQLNLLATGGNSQVIRGSMMTIPVENSMLYVEPIYVKALNANSLPELKKVIVYYNNKLVMENTLLEALDRIFPGDGAIDSTGSGTKGESKPGKTDKPGTQVSTDQKVLIEKLKILFDEAQAAQRAGDWAKYGKKIDELEKVINALK